MSKKRDFKGVASSIVSNKVTSLDDFLGDSEPAAAPPEANPATKASKPAEAKKPPKKTKPSRTRKQSQKTEPEPADQPQKTRMSLFIALHTIYDLDDLKAGIRRMATRNDLSKISKSTIVEAAIEMVKADFEKNGMDSTLVKKILK